MVESLKNIQWNAFKIKDIFDIGKGTYLRQEKIIKGNIPYITAKSDKNGINDFIGNEILFPGNSITIEKINLSAFYQENDFYCSHDVTVIRNSYLNKNNALFICAMINRQGIKYSYGRQAQMNVIRSEIIYLPSNKEKQPDYHFMEKYIQFKEEEKRQKYKQYISNRLEELKEYKEVELLSEKQWKEFYLNEVFIDIQRGKRLKKSDHIVGDTPYVSSTAMNNGIDGFIGNKKSVRVFSNCLTVANSGSVGVCFYQPFSFIASDHITKLENKKFNKYINMFISTIVSRLSENYSFNREINSDRIQKEKIMLPVNSKGEPDYSYMENYIKNIEYNKLVQYIRHKKLFSI